MRILEPSNTIDVGIAYRETRERIIALTADCAPSQWEMKVPHCPAWTVRETLAHLAGVTDDAINANMEGVATDQWTAAQIAKRATATGPSIAAEWATYGPFVDAVATQRGLALSQLLFDTAAHEHDLRFALGCPGARDSDGLRIALLFATTRLAERRAETGDLQFVIDGRRAYPEVLDDALTLRATMFDAVRMFASRRSLTQIAAMDWSADPSKVLPALLPFTPPPNAIEE